MKILYVTTFNKKLYDKSGKNLIQSYLDNISLGDLLVCYEDMEFYHPEVLTYNISKNSYMNQWLRTNKKIIPKFYGGAAEEDDPIFIECAQKGQPWANYRASRFFRKVAALNYALENFSEEYDYIFTIDSDCIFKKNINEALVENAFGDNAAMVYFWGNYRKNINRGPESGFVGYSKNNGGYEFAKIICKCFEDQDFLRFEYWDDGYVIGQLINENNSKFKFKDLVGHVKSGTTHVMNMKQNIFFEYVAHFKSTHKASI